jgi:hypothetical protein
MYHLCYSVATHKYLAFIELHLKGSVILAVWKYYVDVRSIMFCMHLNFRMDYIDI